MNSAIRNARLAGLLIVIAMIAGIFSVAPSVDSLQYLTEAVNNTDQVIIAAVFQFIMGLAYMGVALLFYSAIKQFGKGLAVGFLSFRIIATTLVVIGTLLLLSILALSTEYAKQLPQDSAAFEAIGNMLKITRDHINHVFMIIVLCIGNILLYLLLIKSRLIPRWLSAWGIIGALFSIIASVLVLFQAVDIITTEYIVLNVPTGLQEIVLAIWLLTKGFNKEVLSVDHR
ncbi:MAG: DUF4386 domain-containing protein [Flavipsychrobacter sp.]